MSWPPCWTSSSQPEPPTLVSAARAWAHRQRNGASAMIRQKGRKRRRWLTLSGITGFPPGSPTRCLATWPSAVRLRAARRPSRHEHHRGAVISGSLSPRRAPHRRRHARRLPRHPLRPRPRCAQPALCSPATSPTSTRVDSQVGERRARQKPQSEPVHSTGMELDLISEPAARLRSQDRQGEAND